MVCRNMVRIVDIDARGFGFWDGHFWAPWERAIEGTAMKSGLGTSPKSFIIIRPCYQVQHGGYN